MRERHSFSSVFDESLIYRCSCISGKLNTCFETRPWEMAREPVHPFAKSPDKRQNVSGRKRDT